MLSKSKTLSIPYNLKKMQFKWIQLLNKEMLSLTDLEESTNSRSSFRDMVYSELSYSTLIYGRLSDIISLLLSISLYLFHILLSYRMTDSSLASSYQSLHSLQI